MLNDVTALHREDQQRLFLHYFDMQILEIGSVDLAFAKIFK